MTQVSSDLLAAYGHIEQAEHKKSNEVMADHVDLAICMAIGLSSLALQLLQRVSERTVASRGTSAACTYQVCGQLVA